MGRLINIIPKTFFNSGKKTISNDFEGTHETKQQDLNEARNKSSTTAGEKHDHDDTNGERNNSPAKQMINSVDVTTNFEHWLLNGDTGPAQKVEMPGKSTEDVITVTTDLDYPENDEKDLKDEINNLKRSFLYEQNALMEKCELEKFELRESYEEEKTRLKRAFENERLELIKEIERKDKMLHELAHVLKEEYENNLESYKNDLLIGLEHKAQLFVELQSKMSSIIENLSKIVENNDCHFRNLKEFQKLKSDQEEYNSLSKKLKLTSISNQSLFDNKEINQSELDMKSQRLAITRTLSNPERNQAAFRDNAPREKSNSFQEENTVEDLQFEMAEVYRKQKAELVKLFNAEKEEERKRLQTDKKKFEKETRIEYESRMSVERKGWQETIEDLEREIKILKYEREQMDHNYCIGMDEMRTEFEKEKQLIYRRFSDQQAKIEMKLKEMNKSDTE